MVEQTFVQLTAPGLSAAVSGNAINNHAFQVKVAAIDTSVDVNILGTLDGTNYFKIKAADIQYTANGTYLIKEENLQVKFVKFQFVSEVGGTAATIDVVYLGSG